MANCPKCGATKLRKQKGSGLYVCRRDGVIPGNGRLNRSGYAMALDARPPFIVSPQEIAPMNSISLRRLWLKNKWWVWRAAGFAVPAAIAILAWRALP